MSDVFKFSARRWSDNDQRFGPFTFSWTGPKGYRSTALVLSSTDDEDCGCSLRLSLPWFTFIVALPSWALRAERHKVTPGWDAATIERLGRDWYWNVIKREFGFSYSEGFLQIYLGRQTHDSSSTQSWSCFLPWTQWRFVRHSIYGLNGSLFAHLPQVRWNDPQREAVDALEKACPTVTFAFKDFDGEALTAKTRIDEREWLFGEGWFKWLSLFRKSKVSRDLTITFSGETGPRKGSWKGGTIGHAIEMRPGELHWAAFMRYCAENKMVFGGIAP